MKIPFRIREPFNGVSHFLGAGLSIAGLVVLILLAHGKPWHVSGFSIYGASLILLYLASTLHHSLPVSPRRVQQLLALDQIAIYFLIAGTYTPLCLVILRGPWGWSLFGVIWGLALFGVAARLFWKSAPERLPVLLYVGMGWLVVIALQPMGKVLPAPGLAWLAAGGLAYTVGAVVYATERPRLWPGRFGSHELWHVFVLAGSACHFVLMARFVAPAP